MADGGSFGTANGSSLFIPLSPSPQYKRRPLLPELFLLEAVLLDAIRCVLGGYRGLSRSQVLEAYEWLASERHDWPFSFLNVCDLLEIDAAAIRNRIGVTDERSGSVSRLKRSRTLPALDDGRDAPLDGRRVQRSDRPTSSSRAVQ